MSERLSLYDYLAFVIPGATVLFVAVYGYGGWPRGAPGAAATLGLTAAAFVVGYVNAAIGNWIEPLLTGGKPGGRPDSLWGTLSRSSMYADEERTAYAERLRARYGELPLRACASLAYTELQQQGLDPPLKVMNQHIGFTRGMMTASIIGLLTDSGLALSSGTHLPLALWAPLFLFGALAFATRYRRFWRRFGDTVIRGAVLLPSVPGHAGEDVRRSEISR